MCNSNFQQITESHSIDLDLPRNQRRRIIQKTHIKEAVRNENYWRVCLVRNTEVLKDRISVINTLDVSVVLYNFNILNWNIADNKRMDAKTRKFLHHHTADVDRLYVHRTEGGRGSVQLELSYKFTTICLQIYLENREEWMMIFVKKMKVVSDIIQ